MKLLRSPLQPVYNNTTGTSTVVPQSSALLANRGTPTTTSHPPSEADESRDLKLHIADRRRVGQTGLENFERSAQSWCVRRCSDIATGMRL